MNCFCTKMFLLRDSLKDKQHDEFIIEKEYDSTKSRLYYVNKEFLNKISIAHAIIKFILNVNLHKKGILNYILKIVLQRVKLTTCAHNTVISKTIFKYLIYVNTFNYVKQINHVIKGQSVKRLPENVPFYFKLAQKMQRNNFNKRRI